MIHIIKKIQDRFLENRYHEYHAKSAMRILRKIERTKGKTDVKLIKKSKEYAGDCLGWVGYAPWLFVYSAIAGEFKEGWIPDNYYGKMVIPRLKGKYGDLSDSRGITRKVFSTDLFPDYLYFINDLWFDVWYSPLSIDTVDGLLKGNKGRYVFKKDQSARGEGIIIFDSQNVNARNLQRNGNGVIQPYIRQHPFFDQISTGSVATLRMTTIAHNSGAIKLVASYLRVGGQLDTYVKSASHIRIPVDLVTGGLSRFGYNTEWHQIEKHPHSGFLFSDQKIPHYDKCVDAVMKLHQQIPFVRIVGWDLVVDSDCDVKVMEWNGSHNDIKFSESTQGPIFKDMGLEDLWRHQ